MRLLVLLFVLTSTLSSATVAQDDALFGYVNTYRAANGVKELKWDKELYHIAEDNTSEMLSNDSLMHSGTNTYECAFKGKTLNSTASNRDGFKAFIKKYFDVDYVAPTGDSAVQAYLLMNVVYEWSCSPAHNKVMLAEDATIGAVSIETGDVSFKPNYKMIGGKKIYFKKFISHYVVDYYATLNLNID